MILGFLPSIKFPEIYIKFNINSYILYIFLYLIIYIYKLMYFQFLEI